MTRLGRFVTVLTYATDVNQPDNIDGVVKGQHILLLLAMRIIYMFEE